MVITPGSIISDWCIILLAMGQTTTHCSKIKGKHKNFHQEIDQNACFIQTLNSHNIIVAVRREGIIFRGEVFFLKQIAELGCKTLRG